MKSRLVPALIAVLVAAACGKKEEKPATQPPTPTEPEVKKDEAPPAAAKPVVRDHMKEHFAAVANIKDAIVAGDLETAKKVATELSEHESPDALEDWQFHIDAMRLSSKQLAASASLEEAAVQAAELAGECASCHRVMTAIATFEWSPKPEATPGDIKSHMAVHKWATDRLWEGLVGPSPGNWSEGAELLAGEALHAGEIDSKAEVSEEVVALAKKVHELGKSAVDVAETDGQIELYGKLLGTCAKCHGLTRK